MSFVQRRIDVAVRLAQAGTNVPNVFAGTGTGIVTLSGHRASVRVANSGSISGTSAQVAIWGLKPSLMNQLQTLGMVVSQVPRHSLTVSAGDEQGGMSTVFVGTILEAYGDYNAAPDVPFRFTCQAGAAENAIAYPVSSYNGSVDVATVLSTIASRQNWGFENNGVSVKLSSPYFSGSAMQQVETICDHARIRWALVPGSAIGDSKVLAIWPLYGSRAGAGIPILSKDTGMIGYPSFTQQGILVRTLFNPRIVLGGQVKVESSIFTLQSLSALNNIGSNWNVQKLDLALDAQTPRGQWMSTVYGFNPGFPNPIPRPV